MATAQETVDSILALYTGGGEFTAKRMFGEVGLYLDGKMIALICDDTFFLKPTPGGRELVGPCEEGSPYPGAKPCLKPNAKALASSGKFDALLQATWQELPMPKKKARKEG
ncbi:MAG: hypothetical protein RL318_438 [Fibrobacterota bacterium]|jgi:TfoX/Sxy family transcriptional regulator of competence genes